MEDSFLEELALQPSQKLGSSSTPQTVSSSFSRITERKEAKNITGRRLEIPVISISTEKDEFEAHIKQQMWETRRASTKNNVESVTSPITMKPTLCSSPIDTYPKRKTGEKDKSMESKKQRRKAKHSPSRSKHSPTGNSPKNSVKNVKKTGENNKSGNHNISLITKDNELSKERGKQHKEFQENSKIFDGSAKENIPTESSNETNFESNEEWKQSSVEISKKKNSGSINCENDLNGLMLNAIKNVVSEETTKVMRLMQDLFISGHSNLIKQLIITEDELRNTLSAKDSPRLQQLQHENERLKEDVKFLKKRSDELQKTVDSLKVSLKK